MSKEILIDTLKALIKGWKAQKETPELKLLIEKMEAFIRDELEST